MAKEEGDMSQVNETDSDPIQSAEELVKAYPELCEQLISKAKEDLLKNIDATPVDILREKLPNLVKKIGVPVVASLDPKKGFILQPDDPFAAGTARTYAAAKGCAALQLPAILPFSSKFTKAAIEIYIVRADGAGDTERAKAARKALEKCK